MSKGGRNAGRNRVRVVQRGTEAGKLDPKMRGGVDRACNRGQNFKETSERLHLYASLTAPFCDDRGAKQLIPLECVSCDAPGTSEYLTKEVFHSAFDITQSG